MISATALPPMADRRKILLAGAALFVAVFLFRVPALINPDALDSDAAVVGLQARHLSFKSGTSLRLWGTTYQGITGPMMTGLVRGISPVRLSLAIEISAILGYALGVLALFGVLRRIVPLSGAVACAALIIFVPEPLNALSWTGFRTWAFTLVFVALYFGERALEAASSRARCLFSAAAGLCAGLAYYSDLFIVQLLPGLLAYAAWSLRSLAVWRARWIAAVGALAGFLVGSIPRYIAGLRGPELTELSIDNVARQWPLFSQTCLPYALGLRLFPNNPPGERPDYEPGTWFYALGGVSIVLFVAVTILGIALALAPRTDLRARRLSWCGAGFVATSIVAFLISSRGVDAPSARYLVPILLGFPLLAGAVMSAPAAQGMRFATSAVWLVAVHFALAGWFGYHQWTDGVVPVRTEYGQGAHERALGEALKARGVRTALADYWISYRLTMIYEEQIHVVPFEGDRFEPLRRNLDAHGPPAVIFSQRHPTSFTTREETERSFADRGISFERLAFGPYQAIVPLR